MQPIDYTTLTALCQDLTKTILPARLEQVYQRDRTTLHLALRTLQGRHWLTLSWHAQAARLNIGDAPPRTPDTFTFSQQLWHQLGGLALVGVTIASPWERVADLQFAHRPGDPILWHLYLEVMGAYSNAILVNAEGEILTAAHQVSAQQSSLRPIQTGDRYTLPPRSLLSTPSRDESFEQWRDRLALVPTPLNKLLIKNYRGLSSALTLELLQQANLDLQLQNTDLNEAQWQSLFHRWQTWLTRLEQCQFSPVRHDRGYSVLGTIPSEQTLQTLIHHYYSDRVTQQQFQQIHHQLQQRLSLLLSKLTTKRQGFLDRLSESDRADEIRMQADLLMAHLQDWTPGMTELHLTDFETQQPVILKLAPDRNAVQNAQALYKQHQKFKRSRSAVTPLLEAVNAEIQYLQQVETALHQLEDQNLAEIEDIREELIQQGYLAAPSHRSELRAIEARPRSTNHKASTIKPTAKSQKTDELPSQPRRYQTPNGYELLIGRNNRQNDILTFRTAGDYDLWFHTQEIPGSHVLLRLPAGSIPDEVDLQGVADLAAYYSQARQSEQVPVVYTRPKHVYKPKGAKPGMAIYKEETVIWGNPRSAFVLAVTG